MRVSNTHIPRGILAWLKYGSLIGAGLVLMLAPRFAKRTRNSVQQKGSEPHDLASEPAADAVAAAVEDGQEAVRV